MPLEQVDLFPETSFLSRERASFQFLGIPLKRQDAASIRTYTYGSQLYTYISWGLFLVPQASLQTSPLRNLTWTLHARPQLHRARAGATKKRSITQYCCIHSLWA